MPPLTGCFVVFLAFNLCRNSSGFTLITRFIRSSNFFCSSLMRIWYAEGRKMNNLRLSSPC